MFEELINFTYMSQSLSETSQTNSFKVYLNLKNSNQYIFRFVGDLCSLCSVVSNIEIEDVLKKSQNCMDILFESQPDCFICNVETSDSAFEMIKNIMDCMPVFFQPYLLNEISDSLYKVYQLCLQNNLTEKVLMKLDIIDFYIIDEGIGTIS